MDNEALDRFERDAGFLHRETIEARNRGDKGKMKSCGDMAKEMYEVLGYHNRVAEVIETLDGKQEARNYLIAIELMKNN